MYRGGIGAGGSQHSISALYAQNLPHGAVTSGLSSPTFAGQGIVRTARLSFLPPGDQDRYEQLFLKISPSFGNNVTGEQARSILMQSQLPNDVLGHIWTLADIDSNGVLSFPEFCLAMFLAASRVAGKEVPFHLPDHIRHEVRSAMAILASSQLMMTGNSTIDQNSMGFGMSRSGSQTSLTLSPYSGSDSDMSVVYAGAQSATGERLRWAVGLQEKSTYDQIFKVWDNGTGYISGEKARDIFSASNVPQASLAQIWTLSDIHNHGKLNQDEFAVAMHLIYAKLNGQSIPSVLPPELIPPSTRQLSDSVSSLKQMLVTDILAKKSSSPALQRKAAPSVLRTSSSAASLNSALEDDVSTVYVSAARRKRADSTSSSFENVSSRNQIKETRNESYHTRTTAKDIELPSTTTTQQFEPARTIHDVHSKHSHDPSHLKSTIEEDIRDWERRLRTFNSTVGARSNYEADISQSTEDVSSVLKRLPDLLNQARSDLRSFTEKQLAAVIEKESSLRSNNGDTGAMSEADRIKAKAAAMLAERMAKLGIQQPPSQRPISTTTVDTVKMEEDRRACEQERRKIETQRSMKEAEIRHLENMLDSLKASAAKYETARKEEERIELKRRESQASAREILEKSAVDITSSLSTAENRFPTIATFNLAGTPPGSSMASAPASAPSPSIAMRLASASSAAERERIIKEEGERRLRDRQAQLSGRSPSTSSLTSPVSLANTPPASSVAKENPVEDRLARERREEERRDAEKRAKMLARTREKEEKRGQGDSSARLPPPPPPTVTPSLPLAPPPTVTPALPPPPPPTVTPAVPPPPPPTVTPAAPIPNPSMSTYESALEKKARERFEQEEALEKSRMAAKEGRTRDEIKANIHGAGKSAGKPADEGNFRKAYLDEHKSTPPTPVTVPFADLFPQKQPISDEIEKTEGYILAAGLRGIRKSVQGDGWDETLTSPKEGSSGRQNEHHFVEEERHQKSKQDENVHHRGLVATQSNNFKSEYINSRSEATLEVREKITTPESFPNSDAMDAKPTQPLAPLIEAGNAARLAAALFGNISAAKGATHSIAAEPLSNRLAASNLVRRESVDWLGDLASDDNRTVPESPGILRKAGPNEGDVGKFSPTMQRARDALAAKLAQRPSEPPTIVPDKPAKSSNIAAPISAKGAGTVGVGVGKLSPTMQRAREALAAKLADRPSEPPTNVPDKPAKSSNNAAPISATEAGTVGVRPPFSLSASTPPANYKQPQSVPPTFTKPISASSGLKTTSNKPNVSTGKIPVPSPLDPHAIKDEGMLPLKDVEAPAQASAQISSISAPFPISGPSTQKSTTSNGQQDSGKPSSNPVMDVFSDPENSSSLTPSETAPAASTSVTTRFRYSAIYGYSGSRQDDLNFAEGDVIFVDASAANDEEDWWFGRKESDGTSGYFPRNYVELEDANGPTTLAAPRILARVLYDFNATAPDELSIEEGQVVVILDKECDAGWWKVEAPGGDAEGIVPASYVQELSEDDALASTDYSVDAERMMRAQSFDTLAPIITVVSPMTKTGPPPSMGPSLTANTGMNSKSGGISGKGQARKGDSSIAPSSDHGISEQSSDISAGSGNPGPTAQSWISIIDREQASQLSSEERKRQEAIFELILTEQTYLRDLQLIVEVFYASLLCMLSEQDMRSIFANLDEILLCNTQLLSEFEARQIDDGFVVGRIGDVFLRHTDALKVYLVYCGNQMSASTILQQLRKANSKLAEFLKQCQRNPKCRNLDLSTFLLSPMQRITRYPLLLRQILHYTPKDHEDHPAIVQALDAAERALDATNEAARERENLARLNQISQVLDLDSLHGRLDLLGTTRSVGKRQLLLEGPLTKSKSGRRLYAYLFNDLLILGEPLKATHVKGYEYGLYLDPMPLNEIAFRDIPPTKPVPGADEKCFQIVHIETIITLRASTISIKRKWMNAVEAATSHLLNVERAHRMGVNPSASTGGFTNIGTLQVLICEGQNLSSGATGSVEKYAANAYCVVQLGRQQLKTKVIKGSSSPKWNQALILSVPSLDETLKITVYGYDKYSQDEYMGQAGISLDFLEYYCGKETEIITLKLADVPNGSVRLQLTYKNA